MHMVVFEKVSSVDWWAIYIVIG